MAQRGLEPATSDMCVRSVTVWTNMLCWPVARNGLLFVGAEQYVGQGTATRRKGSMQRKKLHEACSHLWLV